MVNAKSIFAMLILFLFIDAGICQQSNRINAYKNSPQKNLAIARILIGNNAEDSALVFLNACLSKRFDNREALFLRARIYSNQKIFDKALTDYNSLISLNPENKEALYSRGIIRYLLSLFELALNDFLDVLKLPDGETQTAFFKIDAGSNTASGISTISGMESDLWNNIGLCYHAMGQYEQAIQSFDKGIKADENLLDLYINRALTFEKSGEIDRAKRDYDFVLSKNPNHALATYNMLNIDKSHNQISDHLGSLDSFIEENPSYSMGYEARGLFYFESNDFESALSDFKKAVKFNPENIDYLFNLALCNGKLNKTDEAEALFMKVTELDPGHSGAYFNLGNLQFKQGSFDEAISYYTLAHHLNPENASILYNRAIAFNEMNMTEKACLDMMDVKKLDESLGSGFYNKYCIINK